MIKRKDERKSHQVPQAETSVQGAAGNETAGKAVEPKAKGAQETKELLAKLQRVTADFLNYQKRMARNAEEVRLWAKADIIKSLLPIVDDLEQALEAGRNANDMKALLEGFRLVHKHLQDMLGKQQVDTVPTEGRKFDPAIHEAMLQQDSADHKAGTVIAELRKGYTMDGRTLRPARVTVSRKPSHKEKEKTAEEGAAKETDRRGKHRQHTEPAG